MPYIEQERRKKMNKIITAMIQEGVQADGDLNYILFTMATRLTPSYNNYKNFIGELNETIAEIRRRLLAHYEDEKIRENGDIL